MRATSAIVLPAVELRGVSKRFYYYGHRTGTLREWFIRRVLRQPLHVGRTEFVLGRLDVTIARGEAVGLIGGNGSGKSTILRLVAGIYQPTEGTVAIGGRVGAVIELGAGFHPELTGAENVALYGAVLGLSRHELAARYNDLVDFAGIRDQLDTPLKYYSSGMTARLAFAVAVCLEPDTLLLDEVLAVGDQAFRDRCLERLLAFRMRGGTLVLVSHELEQLRQLCSRVIWLEHGKVRLDGSAEDVLAAYRNEASATLVPEGVT